MSSPTETTDLVQMGFSDEIFATLFDMGFPVEMIARAIKETGEAFSSSLYFIMDIYISSRYIFLMFISNLISIILQDQMQKLRL